MLSRRGFLGALLGTGAVATLPATVATEPADLIHAGDWLVQWHGWRDPANQAVTFGFWSAWRDAAASGWYATTTGVVSQFHECDVLNITFMPGWPKLTPLERVHIGESAWSERQRQVKANALRSLYEAIRG